MGEQKKNVTVAGTMTVNWTAELPSELCHESVCCEDPAVEAAMQMVQQSASVYLWGQDKRPVNVFCEVIEDDVEVEDDER